MSVPAALFAFLSHGDSFSEAVRYVVCLGGDTDTIGAMCGAIAGAFHAQDALPLNYLQALEDGQQDRDYVCSLADDLLAAWAATSQAGSDVS